MDVINRTTYEYKRHVNTPDFPTEDWLISPDLTNVNGSQTGSEVVPEKYWKVVGDTVVEMSDAEKLVIDRNEIGNKNFKVDVYQSNKLQTETWYHIDNGDDTYSDKVEETTYVYQGNVVTSKTTKTFKRNGTELTSETWNYYTNGDIYISKRQGA